MIRRSPVLAIAAIAAMLAAAAHVFHTERLKDACHARCMPADVREVVDTNDDDGALCVCGPFTEDGLRHFELRSP